MDWLEETDSNDEDVAWYESDEWSGSENSSNYSSDGAEEELIQSLVVQLDQSFFCNDSQLAASDKFKHLFKTLSVDRCGHQAILQFFQTLEDLENIWSFWKFILDLLLSNKLEMSRCLTNEYSNAVLVNLLRRCLQEIGMDVLADIEAVVKCCRNVHSEFLDLETKDHLRRLNRLGDAQRYPDRPGKAECEHYRNTGRCSYGNECRLHHPPLRLLGSFFLKKHEENMDKDQRLIGSIDKALTCVELIQKLAQESNLSHQVTESEWGSGTTARHLDQDEQGRRLDRDNDIPLFGADLVVQKKSRRKKGGGTSTTTAASERNISGNIIKDLKKLGIEVHNVSISAIYEYQEQVADILHETVLHHVLESFPTERFAKLASKLAECTTAAALAAPRPSGNMRSRPSGGAPPPPRGDIKESASLTATTRTTQGRPPARLGSLQTSYRLTQPTQAYAILPGLIAPSREMHVATLGVDGHRIRDVTGRDVTGLGPTAESASRRAVTHLIVCHNRNELQQSHQHVIDAMVAITRMEAARRISRLLRTLLRRVSGAAGGGGAASGGGAGAADAGGMVRRMFRGIEGPWVLHLTEAAVGDLRALRRSRGAADAVRGKLAKLEKGEWDDSVACMLSSGGGGGGGAASAIPIYEAKPLDNTRILWQVDVGYSHLTNQVGQIIRVWTILSDHKEVKKLLPRLIELNNQRPKEHIAMARLRFFPQKGSRRYVLPAVSQQICSDGGETVMEGNDNISTETLLVEMPGSKPGPTYAEKFRKIFPMSERMVQKLLEGGEVPMQHSVSLKEADIINARQSCLVMGRSGTGKTTCCLFRLLAMQRGFAADEVGGSGADSKSGHRQLFVTKSIELLVRVKKFYHQMVQAHQTENAGISDNCNSDMTLDKAVKMAKEEEERGGSMLEIEVEEDLLSDIPASFSDLQDSHFPLFCTFEKILSMIEHAFQEAASKRVKLDRDTTAVINSMVGRNDWLERGRTRASKGPEGQRQGEVLSLSDRSVWAPSADTGAYGMGIWDCGGREQETGGIEVDFDRFCGRYWPHLDETLRAHFEPQLVWAEIQSLIKGCEAATTQQNRQQTRGAALTNFKRRNCLELEDYLSLSGRRYPSFSHSREKLYKLFENYERLKQSFREHDLMDRVHAVFNIKSQLGSAALELPLIDELYLDEAQDLAPSMMRLLLTLLRHPGSFLMVCGDTAQTIAKGSLFRFEDLTAMVHRELVDVDPAAAKLDEQRLVHNYRSHNGILRLAASVVDLLYTYFPETIDKMERDNSDEEGCLPIVWKISAFLQCLDESDQGWTTLFAGGSANSTIEFGAEQAILVRNEETKKRIMELKQRPGFVGTVFDAKGLEFRDVLLFNFFKDSPAKNEWRVVLEQVRARGKPTSDFPSFDRVKMNILASELKELYTAVTRPQQRLWIVDEELCAGEKHPMLQYWEAGGCTDELTLVNCAEDFDSAASFASFAHRSTPEEWARQGKYLFEHKHFSQAEHCYTRAGEHYQREKEISSAYRLRSEAIKFGNREETAECKARYVEAASCFQSLGFFEAAANCYDGAGMHREAGDTFRKQESFAKAGEQYLKCKGFSDGYSRKDASWDACCCFESAGEYSTAIRILQEAKMWEKVIEFLRKHAKAIDHAAVVKIAKLTFIYFESKKGLQDLADSALLFFANNKERELFLVNHKCYDRLITLYTSTDQFEKAARLQEKQGQWFEAAKSYQKANMATFFAENAIKAVSIGFRDSFDTAKGYVLRHEAGFELTDAARILSDAISSLDLRTERTSFLAHKCRTVRSLILGESDSLCECARFFQDCSSKVDANRDAERMAELVAWEMRALLGLLLPDGHRKLAFHEQSRLALHTVTILHTMMQAISYNDKKAGFWFSMFRASERFFSASSPGPGNTTEASTTCVFCDCWGALLLEENPMKFVHPSTWTPKRLDSGSGICLSKNDANRAKRRFLLNCACKILFCHFEGFKALDSVKGCLPCPFLNLNNRCRDQGKCPYLHESASSSHQSNYLENLLKQCSAVHLLLEIKRTSDQLATDRFADTKWLMPLRRRWLEKLVRAIQPISFQLESSTAVYTSLNRCPPGIFFDLLDLLKTAWLTSAFNVFEAGPVLRTVMLVVKISANMSVMPMQTLQEHCGKIDMAARSRDISPAILKLGNKVKSVHNYCLWFLNAIDQGDAARAIESGIHYLEFIVKCLKDPSMGHSLNPHPGDIIEFMELLSALAISARKGFHDMILPKSYLLPIFKRRELCASCLTGFMAFGESMQHLSALQKAVFGILQCMVNGKMFGAMRSEEQARQKSFDEWRSLCTRCCMLLIFLWANNSVDATQKGPNELVNQIWSLASLPVDRSTMADFKFPKRDKEVFLGTSGVGLFQRVETWFESCLDGLVKTARGDWLLPLSWDERQAEPVILINDGTLLFCKLEDWMIGERMREGAIEWLQVRRGNSVSSGIQQAPSQSSSVAAPETVGSDDLAADSLEIMTTKLEQAARFIREWYLHKKVCRNRAPKNKSELAVREYAESVEPMLIDWSALGSDLQERIKIYRYRALYRWRVPKVYIALEMSLNKLSSLHDGLLNALKNINKEDMLDLAESLSLLLGEGEGVLEQLHVERGFEGHQEWDCDRLTRLVADGEELARALRAGAKKAGTHLQHATGGLGATFVKYSYTFASFMGVGAEKRLRRIYRRHIDRRLLLPAPLLQSLVQLGSR